MLKALFGSKDKELVLQYILSKNEGYASKIARFFNLNPSQIKKQLSSLEEGGVLVGFQIGKARLYKFNPRYYFLNEVQALLIKARDAYPDELREKLMFSRTAPRRDGKPYVLKDSTPDNNKNDKKQKYHRIIHVLNRNIPSEKFTWEEIRNAFLKSNFEEISDRETFIYARFFKECDIKDLEKLIEVFDVSIKDVKKIFINSPWRNSVGIAEIWNRRFRLKNDFPQAKDRDPRKQRCSFSFRQNFKEKRRLCKKR